jgi:class 3 adenylate cyclase
MSLNTKITTAVKDALDEADRVWNNVKHEFIVESVKAMSFSEEKKKTISFLPDLPYLEHNKQIVPNYIALVLDMRKSTEHLLQAIEAKRSQLSRVMTETFALNAMGNVIVKQYGGSITEYTGDGFIAFFKVAQDQGNLKAIRSKAYTCAEKCLDAVREIINPELHARYELPAVDVGIGLAYSQAIVTIVGTEPNFHVKAIGKCVFRASKLSNGKNSIKIDDDLRRGWPTAKPGTRASVRIVETTVDSRFKAYEIIKN